MIDKSDGLAAGDLHLKELVSNQLVVGRVLEGQELLQEALAAGGQSWRWLPPRAAGQQESGLAKKALRRW